MIGCIAQRGICSGDGIDEWSESVHILGVQFEDGVLEMDDIGLLRIVLVDLALNGRCHF